MRLSLRNVTLLIIVVTGVSGWVTSSAEGDRPVQTEALQLDSQDITCLSDQLVQSLMDSGVLDKAPQHPVVYAIGRIKNDTHQLFNTDLLAKKIRVALSNSDKVICSLINTTNTTWVISGAITEINTRSGRATHRTYLVDLNLADVQSNLILWTDIKEITKQSVR